MSEPSFDAVRRLLARGTASDSERATLDRALDGDPALRLRLAALARAILAGDTAELSPAEFGARLHAHVEAELDDPAGFRPDPLIAAHLAAAPEAAAEYTALRSALAALRAGSLPEPPRYPEFDVAFAMREDAARPQRWGWLLLRFPRGTRRPLGARDARSLPWADGSRRPAPVPPSRPGLRELALPALALAALLLLFLRGAPPAPPTMAEQTATARADEALRRTPTSASPDAPPTAATFGPFGQPGGGGDRVDDAPTPSPRIGPATMTPTRVPTPRSTPSPSDAGPRRAPSTPVPALPRPPAPSPTLAGYPGELPTIPPTPVPTDPPETPTDPPTPEATDPPATPTEAAPLPTAAEPVPMP